MILTFAMDTISRLKWPDVSDMRSFSKSLPRTENAKITLRYICTLYIEIVVWIVDYHWATILCQGQTIHFVLGQIKK
jgi:hypothetical protein